MAFRPKPSFAGGSRPPSRSRLLRGKLPKGTNEHRLNDEIRVPQVRLISDTGEQVGVVDTREALRMARDKGLDLMEVAPEARPPVCKIVDYGKFKYEKKKKDHAAKKKQVIIKVKEVQIRPRTDVHDRDYKYKNCRTFLEEGDKVKIAMMFRGREIVHSEQGLALMKELAAQLDDVATIEFAPKMEGRKMIMILAPKKVGGVKPAAPKLPKPKTTTSKTTTSKVAKAKAETAAGDSSPSE